MENQESNNGLQARQFNFPSYMAIINPNSLSRAWSDLLFIAKMAQNIEKKPNKQQSPSNATKLNYNKIFIHILQQL